MYLRIQQVPSRNLSRECLERSPCKLGVLAKESKKGAIHKKKSANKKTPERSAAVKRKDVGKKTIGGKAVSALKRRGREKSQTADPVAFSPEGGRARSGGQSGICRDCPASKVRIRKV